MISSRCEHAGLRNVKRGKGWILEESGWKENEREVIKYKKRREKEKKMTEVKYRGSEGGDGWIRKK